MRTRISAIRRFFARRAFILVALGDLIFRRSFNREISAVYAGMRHHHRMRREGADGSEYFIRRHVHMVEKGLTMRPRRESFGEAYIEELVSAVVDSRRTGLLDAVSAKWAQDTLEMYFEATAMTKSVPILKARQAFAALTPVFGVDEYLGPIDAGTTKAIGKNDFLSFAAAVNDRRSVRWFTQEKVPAVILDRAVELAMESPSACNRLPYHFFVLENSDDVLELASIAGGTAGYVHNLQTVIAVVGDLSAYAEARDRHLIYVDSGLASMTLVYGLHFQGVATCCINWPDSRISDRKAQQILGLQKYQRVVMLIAVGYVDPDSLVPGSGKRSVSSARTFFNPGGGGGA